MAPCEIFRFEMAALRGVKMTTQGDPLGVASDVGPFGFGALFRIDLLGSNFALIKNWCSGDGQGTKSGFVQVGDRLIGTAEQGGCWGLGMVSL